jgi:ABC-type sugar transport system ATPase subunit
MDKKDFKNYKTIEETSSGKRLVHMKGIDKWFGHVHALHDVDFSIYENEIVALVGDNGAGKSTLIKILSGVITADKGEIYVNDKLTAINNPRDARNLGIGTVYQDLALVDCRDVSANLFLGKEPVRGGIFIHKEKMETEAKKILDRLKVKLKSPRISAGFLSGGQRQAIAIGRVILEDSKIFVLDEPTAALGVSETGEVINLIRNLQATGHTLVIISHQLEEVFSLVDRIFVLRQGRKVGDRLVSKTTKEEIIGMITGIVKV